MIVLLFMNKVMFYLIFICSQYIHVKLLSGEQRVITLSASHSLIRVLYSVLTNLH